jgi:hypothetical protein
MVNSKHHGPEGVYSPRTTLVPLLTHPPVFLRVIPSPLYVPTMLLYDHMGERFLRTHCRRQLEAHVQKRLVRCTYHVTVTTLPHLLLLTSLASLFYVHNITNNNNTMTCSPFTGSPCLHNITNNNNTMTCSPFTGSPCLHNITNNNNTMTCSPFTGSPCLHNITKNNNTMTCSPFTGLPCRLCSMCPLVC